MRIINDQYWHFDGYVARRRGSLRREIVETVALTLVLFFLVRTVVPSYWVQGESMLPNLHNDERVLVNRALYFRYDANLLVRTLNPSVEPDMQYLFHAPQRGDIVVFQPPINADTHEDFIKRVIAVEGETVEIKADADVVGMPGRDCGDCGVYVNGVKLDEPYIRQTPNYSMPQTRVPTGHVFVLGDNRRNSSDSHIWGTLEIERIVGAAFAAFWPQDDFGFFPHPSYAEIR